MERTERDKKSELMAILYILSQVLVTWVDTYINLLSYTLKICVLHSSYVSIFLILQKKKIKSDHITSLFKPSDGWLLISLLEKAQAFTIYHGLYDLLQLPDTGFQSHST